MGAAAVARAAPAHPVVTELVPFRVGGCLLVTAPGRLIVRLGGLTFPFVSRLAPGLPLALGLVLALLGCCVFHSFPGWWAAPGKGLDLLIDLTCPKQCVLPDRQHGRLEGVALMHLLVNLPPCVAFGNCQDVVLWRGKTAPDVLTIEPLVPALQVLPGDVELAELRKREDAHEEGVAEHRVHPLELVASFRLAPLFHLVLPVFLAVFHGRSPGSGSALTRYFMGMKPISPPAQSLNWRFISWSLPCRASLGLVSLVFSSQTLSSCPRSHETVRFGAVSPGVCGPVPLLHAPQLPWIVEPREPPGTCGPRSAGRSHPCSGGCWGRSPTPPAPSILPGRASPTGLRGPPSKQNPHPTVSLG